MVTDAPQAITPQNHVEEVLASLPAQAPAKPPTEEVRALFDSIAKERIDVLEEPAHSPLKNVFTALLWFGYAVAIGVALVLVWSAANSLMNSLPR